MNFQKIYLKLLQNHIQMGYLRNPNIYEALKRIQLKNFFTLEQLRLFVLGDRPVLFYFQDEKINRTVSAPHMISMTTTLLELNDMDDILILGAKGGYIETVISEVVNSVVVIEENAQIANYTRKKIENTGNTNISVLTQNPLRGVSDHSEFSKILITGAIPYVPGTLITQFRLNGILVVPLMVHDINFQSILQIVKRSSGFDVVDFGSVIFSPLYVLNMPDLQHTQDLTLKKLVSYANLNGSHIFEGDFSFFEEFRKLPQIEFHNLHFVSENSPAKKIPLQIIKDMKKTDLEQNLHLDKLSLECFYDKVKMIIYNPEPVPISIRLEIRYKNEINEEKIDFILLNPLKEINIEFLLKFPTKFGEYIIELSAITEKNYRIAHKHLKLYILHSDDFLNLVFEPM
ncbi:MAG: protein-L-isoaspartate O-methyltransferase family protein [Promethearchaeota archaeon]